MLRRAILMTAAVSALGAAAFVCVVALAFALFAAHFRSRAAHRHRGFTTAQNDTGFDKRTLTVSTGARQGRMYFAHLARLPFNFVTQYIGTKAFRFSQRSGSHQ